VKNLIVEAGKSQDHPTLRFVGRPSVGTKNVLWLNSCQNKHWTAKSTQLRCRMSFSRPKKAHSI